MTFNKLCFMFSYELFHYLSRLPHLVTALSEGIGEVDHLFCY